MNNKYYIGRHAKSTTIGVKQKPISKVILNGDSDAVFTAGDDSGQTLETFVPTATQQMAEDILSKVKGFAYQGYVANNAFIPPEVELGDGITVGGIYSILASREYSFTPKMTENVSAPYQSEEDHEYNYKGNYAKDLESKVQLGYLYYGVKITRRNGIEIVKTDGNVEKSRVTLNSDTLAFYNDNGQEAMYFDSIEGVFRLTQYANVEGALDGSQAFSQLELTAQQLQLQINDAKGNIASLQITAEGLQSQITSANNEMSAIEQYAKSIRLAVSNGYEESTISLTANGITISSGTVSFTGAVTFTDLETSGSTVINGSNITTGRIDADRLRLTGAIDWADLSNGLQTDFENVEEDAYQARKDAADALADASAASDDIWDLANGILQGGTFIDRQSVFSPDIYAQNMSIIAESSSGGLYLYSEFDSRGYCMFAIEYYDRTTAPLVEVYSPCSAEIEFSGDIKFSGFIDFSSATVSGLN